MKKFPRILNMLLAATAFSITAQAANIFFTGDDNEELMNHLDGTPASTDIIIVSSGKTAVISQNTSIGGLRAGATDSSGTLDITGGTITLNTDSTSAFLVGVAGPSPTPVGTVNMSAGHIHFATNNGALTIGASGSSTADPTTAGSGYFNMTGGTITTTSFITIGNSGTDTPTSGKMEISNSTVTAGFLVGSDNAGVTGKGELVVHHNTNIQSVAGKRSFEIRKSGILRFVVGSGQSNLFNAVDMSTGNNMVFKAGSQFQLDLSDFDWIGASIGDSTTFELINYGTKKGTTTGALAFSLVGTGIRDVSGSGLSFSFINSNNHEYDVDFLWDTTALSVTITDLGLIPEPATYAALAALGALAFVIYRRRKN